MQFHERLKLIRMQTALTQVDMAAYLGMTERGYRNYEIGAREPKLSDLIVIADRFGVTIDYLVGRTDDPFHTDIEPGRIVSREG